MSATAEPSLSIQAWPVTLAGLYGPGWSDWDCKASAQGKLDRGLRVLGLGGDFRDHHVRRGN
jgi:hypothetical protein